MSTTGCAYENASFDKLLEEYKTKYSGKHEFFELLARLLFSIASRIDKIEGDGVAKWAEEEQPGEEWITFKELIDRYPFAKENSMFMFTTYAPEYQDYYRELGESFFLFNPKKLFLYIYNNRKKFPKFHARLRRVNFYGFIV